MRRRQPHPRLHCCIDHLAYDFHTHTGWIRFPGLTCADMDGLIEFFRGIDHHVKRIETIDDDGPSTQYLRGADGWISRRPPIERGI